MAGIGIAGVLIWCCCWIRAWRHYHLYQRIPKLIPGNENRPEAAECLPSLTVIIPACNEADAIESAAKSLLAQDYPNFELIFVNDRSDDGTGEIIERLAAENENLQTIHITTLPAGWLGKVHALHVATLQARGEWLLFTDADVCFEPHALQEIMAYALTEGTDHLAGLPKLRPASLALEVAIAAFFATAMLFVSPKRVANPEDPLAVGAGALNLVRRSAFETTPGFQWLKMETIDDIGLGLMMKRSDAQTRVALAEDQLSLGWYAGLREMARGLEKNSPGLTGYSLWRAAGLLSLFPLALLCLGGLLTLDLTTAITLLGVAVCCPWIVGFSMSGGTSFSPVSFLLAPLGFVLLWFIFARAVSLLWWRGGVNWRGTRYGLAQLRQGQRIDF
ncbi:MAG: glycosyltransferase [Pirellulaceae bacterium]|nr:glycosyltransferase [Pirellulaceae bacterium]